MTTKIITQWLKKSRFLQPLSPGCQLCAKGAKLVVFITGKCPTTCFYCPLSYEKGGNDIIYADEWALSDEQDTSILLQEAQFINAEGAGITGGDPLIVWKRTVQYIQLLKNEYGESFHIHLYTSALNHSDKILEVIDSGLDEIRYHPIPSTWENMSKSPLNSIIHTTVSTSCDVGIEIPVIPGMDREIFALIQWADAQGIKWINLNELEFSERNETSLYQKGFEIKNDISSSVKYSETTAINIITAATTMDLSLGIHYCSSSFKDAIQLTNRIKRRAHSIARDFDIITEEGTIIKGIIEPLSQKTLHTLISYLTNTCHLRQPNDFFINTKHKRIELHAPTLEKIRTSIPKKTCSCYIIEQYPTADELEVERIPLSP
ncbi:MAG: radical SAM protein [Candidatus Heimdallarchaeota archaeon]|nr:radical SAM protein [Candidatus Heimdallarchaeota archaeon]